MNKEESNKITQYFSKWRSEWVYFSDDMGKKYTPNDAEIKEHLKYEYKLR